MPPTSAARNWARNWARNRTGDAMFSQIAHLLIQTAFGLLVYTLLLRFYMQTLRAPFRNPVGQLVTALTNWIVLPARRELGEHPRDRHGPALRTGGDRPAASLALPADRRSAHPSAVQLVQSSGADRAGPRRAHPPFLYDFPALRPSDRQRGSLTAFCAGPGANRADPAR